MTSPLLAINELTMMWPDGEKLLDSVSLEVEEGEAVSIVGESGCGKTLTCRSILGSLPSRVDTTGQVLFDGHDVLTMSSQDLRRHRVKDVALVSQDPRSSMNPVTRVGRFLTASLVDQGRMSRRGAEARAAAVLNGLGFSDPTALLDRYPHELSGGMLQRLVVAAAVMTDARLIIADEATSALDVTNQAEVARLLKSLCREHGIAIVFVTHDLDLAGAVADRVVVMRAGKVLDMQSSKDIYVSPGHPYTAALAACRPRIDRVIRPLPTVEDRILTFQEGRHA